MRCKIVGVDNFTGNIVKNLIKPKSGGKEIEEDLKKVANEMKVSRSHIAPDSGGMGSYLESYMEGIKPFDGAHAAYDKEYRNLRSECYFKLAELVNKKEIYIDCDDPVIKESIIEELEQIKRDNIDKDDQKKKIISKEIIKEMLGRSPDFADILMMRMFFVVGMGKMGILTGGKDIFGWKKEKEIGYCQIGLMRNYCLERDRYTCKKCGYATHKSQLIGDHIIPIALGGDEWDPKNVQTLCIDCDKIKTIQDQKDIAIQRRKEKIDNYKNNQIIK